ncbi:hypothetical protein C6500_18765 [Candidatus Poribacteria bacterium]|nr:MAG: hypothetical protein C6500_18765 [Candidatus Poribacteria bacterium]
MMNTREGYAELQARISGARRVWKRSLFWTGFAIVLTGVIALLVGEAIVDWLMPLPGTVRITLLGVGAGIIGYLLYKYLVQPLRASLTLRDVALNVERNHPDLEDRLVSAIEFGNRESADPIETHMLQRLLEDTTERVKGINFKATIDHSRTRKHVGIAALVVVGCVILSLLFPTEIHTSLLRVLVPWEKTDPILTTKLAVEPGNARILRGKSLPIHVTVTGKSADKVVLTYRDIGAQQPSTSDVNKDDQQINMLQNLDDKRGFAYEIFNIDADMEYYVVANEATSERYTVEVFEMPKVAEISVAYTYPDYTGLKPVVQTGTGDIHAVVGTQAEIRLTTNKAIQTASIAISLQQSAVSQELSDAGENVRNVDNDLPRADSQMVISDGNTLTTTIDVVEDGSYDIQLLCIDGFNNEIPIEYMIRAIPDAVPEVVIKEPGRDVKATKLDEVEIIAEATDDYGIAELKLMYRIGSDELQELVMESSVSTPAVGSGSGADSRHTADGAYTFYLEEFDVEPGDIISYYAHATDNNTRTGPGEASSDLYFIEIRPFNENFHEGESEGEPGQAEPNPLSDVISSQKEVIRETSKHIHAKPITVTQKYQTAVRKTGEKQTELKDKTQRVVDEFSAAMQGESAVTPEILMNLEDAIDKMGEASESLNAVRPDEAIPPEQEALELLIKVSLEIPKVLMQMRNSNPQLAEELELEMEELQSELENQQNELDMEMQEQTQEMLDQARQMLGEQQQLSEQSQQLGRENQPSPSEMQQNSQQQGQLAQQAQQMAQQLNTMQQSGQGTQGQRLNQAGEAMQQASEQMEEASQGMQQEEPQLSAAKGEKAEERLQEAIEQLEKVAAEYTDAALDRASQQLQELTEAQSDVQQQTQELRGRSQESEMRPEDFRRASELANQQRELQRNLETLERTLRDIQEQLTPDNPEAAQNVADATRRLVEEQTAEDMATAQRALQWRSFRAADQNQQAVLDTLEQTQGDLQQARANMANTEEEQLEAELEQLQQARERMQDIQRELQAMEGQEQTEEQQQRREQLAQQQQQIQEQMQRAQEARQRRGENQPGNPDEPADQEARVGGRESDREIDRLWLGMLDTMDYQPGNRSNPFPNYEFVIRDLGKLESALEERLNTLQEKKRLAQVAKEDVPPEYRKLVDDYYEFLSQ